MIAENIAIIIKPHYRSEGPRQGSCAIFGGVWVISRVLYTTMENLVAELVINFINMSPQYRWELRRDRVFCGFCDTIYTI